MKCAFHSPIAACFHPKMIPKNVYFCNTRFVISSGCRINLDQPAIELRVMSCAGFWLFITRTLSCRPSLAHIVRTHNKSFWIEWTFLNAFFSLSALVAVGAHDSKAFLLNIKFFALGNMKIKEGKLWALFHAFSSERTRPESFSTPTSTFSRVSQSVKFQSRTISCLVQSSLRCSRVNICYFSEFNNLMSRVMRKFLLVQRSRGSRKI